ncbi:unnamed protein product [[Actinomadura] parvosata subsp. kistnae]|uniref:DUF732 domain-containing protein n=1 Tax=[Actinomadura] parvosata subsp. kistnae TaxID=1909395 RepID=A0A1U9ZTV9_9ACTN|nr:hypothetical protein [Nonomuraea sp. ATCC 55076]AQZ61378.1 hypothetical protein BKM31_07695 [Nonomuraea sp. ATCC 55076]SPL98052.1 unnamed protein product [Actinomadura parvosata subsp. kistnae]
MTSLTKKLLGALAAAALAGSGVAAAATLPASAAAVVSSTLFTGMGQSLDEDTALAIAEADARADAAAHGFTECGVFESVSAQSPKLVWTAWVTVRCLALSR